MGEETETSPSDVESLIVWLRERDVECPLCKYNLRNLKEPRCPECGQKLRLGVHLVEPFLKAWILCCVPSCLVAGIGLLLLTALVAKGDAPMEDFWGVTFCVISLGMVPAALFILLLRRRFLKLNHFAQWLMANIAWIILITDLVMFFKLR